MISVHFFKLPEIATSKEVSDILQIAKSAKFDDDPDSVDGMSTYMLSRN